MKTSYLFRRCLDQNQYILLVHTSARRLRDVSKTSSGRLAKTSSTRIVKTSSRHIEDFFKASSGSLAKMSSRHFLGKFMVSVEICKCGENFSSFSFSLYCFSLSLYYISLWMLTEAFLEPGRTSTRELF